MKPEIKIENITTEKVANGVNVQWKANGQEHIVTVKELTIRKLYEFVKLAGQNNTPEFVSLACGKDDAEWTDNLPPEVFGRLVKVAMELNFSRAMTLAVAGDEIMAALCNPVMNMSQQAGMFLSTIFEKVRARLTEQLPKSAQPESAAATGSGSSTSTPQVG